jgi:AcrR family transcriptional regulator
MTHKKAESLQRALDVAATLFTLHRFEGVSIAAIARSAHCSTTTIYDVWSSKEQLFIAAMTARLRAVEIPLPPPGGSGFEMLLQWALQRVRTLSSPAVCDVWRAVLRQTELMRSEMATALQRGRAGGDQLLKEAIARSIEEGSLRPADPGAIETHFRAVTAHGTLLGGLMCDQSIRLSEQDTLVHLFEPLVTEQGRTLLDRFTSALQAAVELAAPAGTCSATFPS